MIIICRPAVSPQDLATCLKIRESVFIKEQQVPAELERDGLDDQCLHFMAEVEGKPLATARVMLMDDKFKFQRVAVLRQARGLGLGATLMRFMMDDLAKRDDAEGRVFFLSSQVSAIPFYERLGFKICSDIYMDAGIEHRDMRRAH